MLKNHQKILKIVFSILLFLYAVYFLNWMITKKSSWAALWDFRVYYWTAETYKQSLNPYNAENVIQIIETKSSYTEKEKDYIKAVYTDLFYRFAYPPLIIKAFSLITSDPETSVKLFIILKTIAMLLMFLIWFVFMLPLKDLRLANNQIISLIVILTVVLYGWNNAIHEDMKVGNVSIFEQVFIWSALLLFFHKKYGFSALFIALAGSFKIMPLGFSLLFLPLIMEQGGFKKAFKCLIIVGLTFGAFHLINYLWEPELYSNYLVKLSRQYDESRGYVNPCLMAALRDLADIFSLNTLFSETTAQLLIHLSFLLIASISGFFYLKSVFLKHLYKNKIAFIMLTCFFLAMIAPRFKDYSYILLIPPVLYLLSILKNSLLKIFILILVLLPITKICYNFLTPKGTFILNYTDYFAVVICFIVFINSVKNIQNPEHHQ